MENFNEVIQLFDKINIDNILANIMNKLSDSIIEINQEDQLSFGIDAKGQIIETLKSQGSNVYAQYTIGKRNAAGKQTDKVDLNFSGKFWKTFKVKKVSEGWEVTADFNLYDTDIRSNFNTKFDFLGLTPPNLEDFVIKEVLPKLELEIRKQLKI